jgi:predicted ATPase
MDAPLIRAITLRHLLSFGPEAVSLPLESLNVLVGPNGSGKSNLLEAIALLRSSSTDFRPVISRGGGVGEWIWKGQPHESASVEAVVASPRAAQPLRHVIEFRQEKQTFHLEDERVEYEEPDEGYTEPFGYRYRKGNPIVTSRLSEGRTHERRVKAYDPSLSILAQRVDLNFPGIADVANAYDGIRLYREWVFGRRNTAFRDPQKSDLRTDRLEEDFSNLGLFLSRLRRSPKTKQTLLSAFRDLYEGLTDFDVSIEGGTVQVFFSEGEFIIPATRLSDGSVRYLCLLAMLCDPKPPPLIGIEEPELGLHPDLLPKVADLLIDASQRTQLIVTTHSDILVDALTERPSSIVVCEKHDGKSTMRRLEPAELSQWLEKYRLGDLWTRGQLGGTRW